VDVFNWFYAAIGVALGIAGGIFRGVIANLCILGFLFFSATFGLQWAAMALFELFIGYMLSGFFINNN